MKKHFYKLLAGVMMCTLLVSTTACGVKEDSTQVQVDEEQSKGRYVEETLELPEGVISIIDYTVKADGTISLLGKGEEGTYAYTMQGDNGWQKESVAWIEEINETGGLLQSVAYNEGEISYISYIKYTDQGFECYISSIVDGKIDKTVALEDTLVPQGHISQIHILENNQIIASAPGMGAFKMDWATGEVITEYLGYEASMAVTKDQVMVVDSQRGGVVVYDKETGEQLDVVVCEGNVYESQVIADSSGQVYLVNKEGVKRLATEESKWEEVIDGNRSAFGIPSFYMRDIRVSEGVEFVALFSEMGSGLELNRYTYDANALATPESQLTLYMFEDNQTIRQVVADYQRQNPDVAINIEIGMDAGSSMTTADAIRTLNTQLLAGKGPDILILDGLPVGSYIEKGVLLDMADFAQGIIDSGEMMTNVLESFIEEDGGIYTLPTKFEVSTMWGNEDLVNGMTSMEELATWQEANGDKKVFYDITPQSLMSSLYSLTAHTWLDEEGYIQEEAFVAFLEGIHTLSTDLTSDPQYREHLAVEAMAYNEAELHIEQINNFYGLSLLNSAMKQSENGDFNISFGESNGIFTPKGLIGINANSAYKDIAKELVNLALSQEVQEVQLGDGFSVHRGVLEEESIIKQDSNMTMGMAMSMGRPIDMVPVTQDVNDQLMELLLSVHTPAYEDDVLLTIILEETKGYFDGTKTVQEAAAGTANRTKAYLSE